MDSIAAVTGWPNSPTRATSEASPPASGAAVVTSTGVPASVMACTSRRVLLRSNPTCSMGPGLLPSRLSALTSSVLRGEAPVFMAFSLLLRGDNHQPVWGAARHGPGDGRRRPLHPGVGLLHALPRPALPRPGSGLAAPAQRRGPRSSPGRPAGAARPHRDSRPGQLTLASQHTRRRAPPAPL